MNTRKLKGTQPKAEKCPCGNPLSFPTDRYCRDCGCRWCGGDARDAILDNQGRGFDSEHCEDRYHAFMRAESMEA